MFNFIQRVFIPGYKNCEDASVRERYGFVFSVLSIILNIILVIFKLVISFITNSISIRADAFNNLSDVASNVATMVGFRLANRHPDSDHPYGHGRMEYIAGLIVSFLILMVGFTSIRDSFIKILNPETISYSDVALIVLIVSISIKLLMCYLNRKAGNTINSDTLRAAGQDSLNDSFSTGATLVSLLVMKFLGINIDAYMGCGISILVILSGFGIFKNITDTILGKAPDKELIEHIKNTVMAHKEVHGIHDLMYHDYGPGSRFLIFHAEVDANGKMVEIHDVIDNIEREILEKYSILTTIHMDPVDYNNKDYEELYNRVKTVVQSINPEFKIHDFRFVKGNTHTNLIFDCVIPASDQEEHETLAKIIEDKVNELPGGPYYCIVTVEHSFVD